MDPDGDFPIVLAPLVPLILEGLAVAAEVAIVTGAAVGITELIKHTDTSAPGMLYSKIRLKDKQTMQFTTNLSES